MILGLPFWADGSSRLVRSAAKGLPAIPSGSTGWVDVRDVAAAVVHGLRQPAWGERYILNGSNQTFEAFYGGIADRLGTRRAPVLHARWPYELAWRLLALIEALGGPTAQLTKDSVRAATNKGGYRNDKARNWGSVNHVFGEHRGAAQHEVLVFFAKGHQGRRVHGVVGALEGGLDVGGVFEVGAEPIYLVPTGSESLKFPALARGIQRCLRTVQPADGPHSGVKKCQRDLAAQHA